jgi:DHA1 family bicyclomycin/chloramphenicol resistance-like MFS transporter
VFIGLLVVGVFCGNAITRRLSRKMTNRRLLFMGSGLSAFAAAGFVGLVLSGELSVTTLLGVMFFFTLGAGITSPAALGSSLGVDGRIVGSAAGLYGCVQMLAGAVCTSMTGWGSNPALSAAWVMLGVSLLVVVSFWAATLSRKP